MRTTFWRSPASSGLSISSAVAYSSPVGNETLRPLEDLGLCPFEVAGSPGDTGIKSVSRATPVSVRNVVSRTLVPGR